MVMMAMMAATIMASDDGAGKRRPDDISPFPKSMSCDHSQRYLKLNCALCDTTNYTRLRRCPSTHVNVAPPPRMVARRYERCPMPLKETSEYYMFIAVAIFHSTCVEVSQVHVLRPPYRYLRNTYRVITASCHRTTSAITDMPETPRWSRLCIASTHQKKRFQ